jgi:hypothetical protein
MAVRERIVRCGGSVGLGGDAGTAGFVVAPAGRVFAIAGLTVSNGGIVAFDVRAEPQRLRRIGLAAISGWARPDGQGGDAG